MPNFFYFDQFNQKQGPVNDQQLKELAAQGAIGPQTPLETDTGHQGTAGQIPGLFPVVPPQPHAAPPSAPVASSEESFLSATAASGRSAMNFISSALGLLLAVTLVFVVGGVVWWVLETTNVIQTSHLFSSASKLTAAEQTKADKILAEHGKNSLLHMTDMCEEEPDEESVRRYVKYFVSKGADVNVKNKNSNNETLLHHAAGMEDLEMVNLFISKGANVNARCDKGRAPIHLAAQNDNVEVMKLLVSKGANIEAKEENGATPLHYAAINNCLEVAKFLVSKGAKVSSKSDTGMTPLHYGALSKGDSSIAVVKFLVSKGADVNAVSVSNNVPLTPLDFAKSQKNFEIVDYLLDQGAREGAAYR